MVHSPYRSDNVYPTDTSPFGHRWPIISTERMTSTFTTAGSLSKGTTTSESTQSAKRTISRKWHLAKSSLGWLSTTAARQCGRRQPLLTDCWSTLSMGSWSVESPSARRQTEHCKDQLVNLNSPILNVLLSSLLSYWQSFDRGQSLRWCCYISNADGSRGTLSHAAESAGY